jgi:hypothetical protein
VNDSRRATTHLNPDPHRSLRVKTAKTDRRLSELVNAAVRRSLLEDPDDLAAFDERAHEPNDRGSPAAALRSCRGPSGAAAG